MRTLVSLAPFALLLLASPASAQNVESSWSKAKNASADNVYHDNDKTLYCGCTYASHNDNDGSGDVDLAVCDMGPLSKKITPGLEREFEVSVVTQVGHNTGKTFQAGC